MNKLPLFLSIAIVGTFFTFIHNQASQVPLIPRSILFGNPEKAMVRISPDGKFLSYLAPSTDVTDTKDAQLNVWIRNRTTGHEEQLTHDHTRPIRQYMWSPDSSQILYLQDTNGDENWRLYGLNISTKKLICYTPFANIQARLKPTDKHFPHTILVELNKEDPKTHDVYKLDLISGELTLLEKNDGTINFWLADTKFQIRAALSLQEDGTSVLLVRDTITDPWRPLIHWSVEDSYGSAPIAFNAAGTHLYLIDSHDSATKRLVSIDIKSSEVSVIAQDPEYDIEDVYINQHTHHIEAVTFNKEYREWHIIDPTFKALYEKLRDLATGTLYITSSDDTDTLWTVVFETDTAPFNCYLYDTQTNKGQFLFSSQKELLSYKLAPTFPISYSSRDGLTIHGYITYPLGVPHTNLPLILQVHGGPWLRDSWRFDPVNQWLANRGYAVLQVNYRGSRGFGKAFLDAGDKEWGNKMQHDLTDAVAWAVNNHIADPQKIAIYGGSYGGYATLAGAAFTPELYCCGIDIVGISNLLTFLKAIPPYWEKYKWQLAKQVGNIETEEEFLKERSPLFQAHNIKIPLLIAQGAHDPRVKQEEAEQIVAALKEKNIPHEYLLFSDEGHGLAKPENRMLFYQVAEKFLAQHLGGRYET